MKRLNSKYSIEKEHRKQLWNLEIQMVNSSLESDVRFNDFSFFFLNFDHISIGWRYIEKKYYIKVPQSLKHNVIQMKEFKRGF